MKPSVTTSTNAESALRVLLLEDSTRDAEILVRELHSSGFEPQWTRVDTEEDFRSHINGHLDLVIADYTLPQFDAPKALKILQDMGFTTPFIVVTGSITEETAVTVLKQGADDFLLKDRLGRLGPAVRNALKQRQLRDERSRNLAEREKAATRILQLSRLYAALSAVNEALVRSKSPDEVFAAVCRACVDHGGFKLAWVGLADQDLQRIIAAEAYGSPIEYLDGMLVSTEADLPIGQGPTGTAYREQRVYVCNDFAAEPVTAPWRQRAERFGFAASISLPFSQGGKPIGALTAYGGEKNVFDQESGSLLQRMAENVSFAMDQFEFGRQRQNLAEQRALDMQRLAKLSRRVVAVQEEERRRLARELHDRTSPNLTAVALNLGMIAADLPPTLFESFESRLVDTRMLLADTIADIRDVCAELRLVTLDYAGLQRALQEYAELFSRRTGIAVEVSCTDPDKRLATGTESLLFRITQEALANAAKHAKASTIKLQLVLADERTMLTIYDNGVGFDLAALGRSGNRPGLGLLTMRERAEFAGGKFSLESRPGQGTRIKVAI